MYMLADNPRNPCVFEMFAGSAKITEIASPSRNEIPICDNKKVPSVNFSRKSEPSGWLRWQV